MQSLKKVGLCVARSARVVSPQFVVIALVAFVFALTSGHVMADTDITTMVTDASTLWDAIKTLLIGIVGFTLLLSVIRLIRKRA